MPKIRRNSASPLIALVFLLTAGMVICLSATIDVGSGAPSIGLTQRFQNAFFRNGFAYLVSLPPVNNVQRFGSTGLIQVFNAAGSTPGAAQGANSGSQLALVKANMTTALPTDGSVDVAQVLANMYSYYNSVGVNTAGYPTTDTLNCPAVTAIACEYQFFNKNYVLFTYDAATFNGDNFAVRDPYYTKWKALGGIDGLGPAADIERNITINGGNATVQEYFNGLIFNNTSGTLNTRVFAVTRPIYAAYVKAGGYAGFLGLPTSDDIALTGGGRRQSFQGGNLDYQPGSEPMVRLPVDTISLQPYATVPFQLKQGDTLPLHAYVYTSNAVTLTDRLVNWTSSNSRVVVVEATNNTGDAVARAVGQGSALITAVSEGKVSPSISLSVSAVCCQIGEGAPNPTISQAIQDAVTRNRLTIALPAKSTVQRTGAGYLQELYSTGSPGIRYVIAKADISPTAYVVTGDFLARYDQMGGPAGALGYPASDGAPGGHQLFSNSNSLASAGPVRVVSGAILTKWSSLNFESGAAGLPVADAASVVASTGTRAQQQAFARGVIYAAASGPRAGQAQLMSGLILDRYTLIGGPAGAFGLPVNDEYGLDGRRRQDFEVGYIDYAPGDAAAAEHGAARRPAVSANPANTVVAGSRLRLSVTGFDDNSTIRVSITDQQDFVVTAANGSYIWETFVPLSAPSKTFTIHAVDSAGVAADGSYTVKALTESKLQLLKASGDAQTAAPGATLAQKLKVQLQDENGTPVIGIPVTFAASPGAQLISSTSITDETGQAEAVVRVPLSEGLALVTAEAARLVSTFSARAVASTLPNFPAFLQTDSPHGQTPLGKGPATVAQKGALLTAAASVVRYYQNHGDLRGVTDPAALNQFLTNLCHSGSDGAQVCDGYLSNPDSAEQVVNLWRVGGIVADGIDISVETPEVGAVRDLVSQGAPALIALNLTANGAPAGGHFVVAFGVTAEGSILVRDPNPDFGRNTLDEYVGGFTAGGKTWQGTPGAVVRFIPKAPAPTGFLMAALSQPPASIETLALESASIAGVCGKSMDWQDTATVSASLAPRLSRLRYCDGAQSVYQLSVGGAQAYKAFLYDLGPAGRRADLSGGGGQAAFKATRSGTQFVLAPQDVALTPGGMVNAATLTPGVAPGGLMTIVGTGLAGPGADSVVEVNGTPAQIATQTPFQINVQVPPDLPPGTYPVRVQSPYGSADQMLEVQAAAPAIYVVSGNLAAARGVVTNQNGSMNTPFTPGMRGQRITIYCTGLGAVTAQGSQFAALSPVTVILNKAEIQPVFAGLAGDIGLYMVTIMVPPATPPGIDLPLALRQAGVDSNTVFVAVQ
ncbi:MAG TPA: Ig-like domain-containing protein [Bryobacteraceae bacterium]|nr:Ig-like domain-containing protein [Bryobacteraceae bacterium]